MTNNSTLMLLVIILVCLGEVSIQLLEVKYVNV